jgi:hypothetical protein
MGLLRHRPQESNVAVASLLRNKKGGKTHLKKRYIIYYKTLLLGIKFVDVKIDIFYIIIRLRLCRYNNEHCFVTSFING